jgi:hypothetical protein
MPSQRKSFLSYTDELRTSYFCGYRSGDPAGLTEHNPLMLPVVVKGNFYLASLGHPVSPWDTVSDWSVTVDRLEGDKKVTAASFAIGMAKGSLIDARVK